MAIYKNVASQKIAIYAHDTAADTPKTGNAASITAQISLDGGATAATNDVNPTELDATDAPGIYIFDMTQAETYADLVILSAVSGTADISIESVIVYTLPTWAASQVAQTADHAAGVAAILDDTGTAGVVVAAGSKTGYSLSAAGIQAVWDALTSGLVTAGSIGKYLLDNLTAGGISGLAAAVWAYATRTLTANINGVTIVSAVSGNTITVYEYATWGFTLTDTALALTDYENLIFVVKDKSYNTDSQAVLLLDITNGLIRIGGAAPTAANLGSVVKNSATSFTVLVAMSEVTTKIAGDYSRAHVWQLKGIDTGDDPDQGFVLIEGKFTVRGGKARAII